MKKLLIGAALLLTSLLAFAHPDPEGDLIKHAICSATRWEGCKEVPAPIAVKSTWIVELLERTMPGYFLYGFYIPGEPYIYVRTDIERIRMYETLVHESIHYYYNNTRPEGSDNRCESEYFARYYTTKVLSTEFDTTWWERYSCPDYKNAAQP